MKKNISQEGSEKKEEKSTFYKAGEIIGSIGFHIVDGKDKAVGAVSDGFNILKKVIKKKPGKKQAAGPKTKRGSKKKSHGKTTKKNTKGFKKSDNKANLVKAVIKKASKLKKSAENNA